MDDKHDRQRVGISVRGATLLNDPLLNKGTAFPASERAALGLVGLIPDHVSTFEEQLRRAYDHIARKDDPLERYIGLAALQDRNEHLFYRLLMEHVEEFLPIVYTPTVGLAAQRFSRIYRKPRGIWITPDHAGRIGDVLANAARGEVRLIVVTDNERILGLGDQGAGGMVIPVGKLALYTLGAGLHPGHTLPVSLDVGTDNETLLSDPLYLGWRQRRLRGEEYEALVEEFVESVRRLYPKALLQWEDFKQVNAMGLLQRYRKRLLSFNDDIQGTAAVAVAGILAAVGMTAVPIRGHRVLILGAGAAGMGIAQQLRGVFSAAGARDEDLSSCIALMDSHGLLVDDRTYRAGEEYKLDLAWTRAAVEATGLGPDLTTDLEAVVRALRPTILVGTSGQGGAFGRAVVEAMADYAQRPIIFPMSNPTSQSEATPADLITWTEGRALIATGSPFDPVPFGGRTYRISQGNNVYVFPGVGLGALVAGASEVTDHMFSVAARTLAGQVTEAERAAGLLYPSLTRLRQVSAAIAEAVVKEAVACGVASPMDESEIAAMVRSAMWCPDYPDYEAI